MIKFIKNPSVINAAGTGGKIIKEYIGRVNSKTSEVSIAHMNSPEGWEEPGQCPEFDEYTVVLKGSVQVKTKTELHVIREGQGIITGRGEWVQYSTPFKGGAEYIAVCLPAFSPDIVHRDQE
jgi:mannose-6-phosphate isomerase-like protein (cupin superfamily)